MKTQIDIHRIEELLVDLGYSFSKEIIKQNNSFYWIFDLGNNKKITIYDDYEKKTDVQGSNYEDDEKNMLIHVIDRIKKNSIQKDVLSYYLKNINLICDELCKDTGVEIFGFRGEQQVFAVPCIPNIFRNSLTYSRMLDKDDFIEKNIIEEILANGLSSSGNHLLSAIDAQHGGFPSRLLDITFNVLVALFFATTPHYTETGKMKEYDELDGVLYIYPIKNLTTTSDTEIQNLYYDVINNKKLDDPKQDYNYRFIDYTKSNPRIIAQHGGLILFPGSRFLPFSDTVVKRIIIDKDDKKVIRKELDKLFGINMSSIYPESTNYVDPLMKKIKYIKNLSDEENTIENINISNQSLLKKFRDVIKTNKDQEISNFLIKIENHIENVVCSIINISSYPEEFVKRVESIMDEFIKEIRLIIDYLNQFVNNNVDFSIGELNDYRSNFFK